MKRRLAVAIIVPTLVVFQGCRDERVPTEPAVAPAVGASVIAADQTRDYIVLFASERVHPRFAERVAALGSNVVKTFDAVGIAVVRGITDAAAAELATVPGVAAVEPDLILDAETDAFASGSFADFGTDAVTGGPGDVVLLAGLPSDAQFYSRQWNMRAIAADAAWVAGYVGSEDVTVAILDSGIDYTHPDLAGRVDLSRSISLVPAEDERVAELFPGMHPITDLHGHGTASAGLVVTNGLHVAGVTQRTTLFGVKVSDGLTTSPLSLKLEALLYAADQGADVIQMSFSTTFDRSESPGSVAAVQRVVNYVHRKGAVLVTFAGNTAGPLNVEGGPGDYDQDGDRFRLCNAVHVICAAATGPTSAAGLDGPWENVDLVTPYSHFGFSAIDIAAPGGSLRPGVAPPLQIWVPCSRTAVTPGPPFFRCKDTGSLVATSTGTSWSAAMTSGLAALLVSTIGKDRPDQVQAVIKNTADDLGDPGFDKHYGHGRINAGRAVGALR